MLPEDLAVWSAVAAFIGVGIRAILPYLDKAPLPTWKHKYTVTALAAAIGAVLTTWDAVREYANSLADSNLGMGITLVLSFVWGYYFVQAVNGVVKLPRLVNKLRH